ncbi:MAG: hypothetical protein AB7S26_35455 [Sandaracinaceae bacterium]
MNRGMLAMTMALVASLTGCYESEPVLTRPVAPDGGMVDGGLRDGEVFTGRCPKWELFLDRGVHECISVDVPLEGRVACAATAPASFSRTAFGRGFGGAHRLFVAPLASCAAPDCQVAFRRTTEEGTCASDCGETAEVVGLTDCADAPCLVNEWGDDAFPPNHERLVQASVPVRLFLCPDDVTP